jgi:hypothetical protein
MQSRYLAVTGILVMLAIVVPVAQTPAPQPPKAAEPAARPEPAQPINVRVELTISEQTGQAAPATKVVTLMTSDRQNGSIRSVGSVPAGERYRTISINVDARPTLLRDGSMRLDVALEYQPQSIARSNGEPGLWTVNERVTVVLASGKPLLISETFDPTSDRRVTVEVKATLLM